MQLRETMVLQMLHVAERGEVGFIFNIRLFFLFPALIVS